MKLDRILATTGVAGVLALGLVACGGDEGSTEASSGEPVSKKEMEQRTDEPDAAIQAGVEALKENDVMAFLQTIAPPEAMEEMRREFERSKTEEAPSDSDRQQFAETMARLTADDAVDQLMVELEPQLAQMAAQLPMMMGFGQMMAQQAVQENETLSDDQKAAAQESVTAAFTRLQGIDFADTDLARAAVTVVVETARELDVKTMEDVEALAFEEVMGKAGTVLGGTKQLLNVYGISLNDMLDSVSTEVVSEQGDEATVKVDYSMFGTPQSTETKMVRKNGRWYAANVLEDLEDESGSDDADEMEAEPEAEPTS